MQDLKQQSAELSSKIANLQSELETLERKQLAKTIVETPLKTLYRWQAPNRLFTEHSKLWYTTVALAFMLAIAFAAISKDIVLLIVLVVLMVLVYITTTIRPEVVAYEINTRGIRCGDSLWLWQNIDGYWISRRGDQLLLFLDLSKKMAPNRVLILIGTADPKKLVSLISRNVTYFSRKQTQEDWINIFTLGDYQPLSLFEEEKAV